MAWFRHTYLPKVLVDFAGPSYFGGRNNELVICPGKGLVKILKRLCFFIYILTKKIGFPIGGDIHIWDQESGALLHLIRVPENSGDLTCIAWNNLADDPFMFASGSYDGGVQVWTRHPDEGLASTNNTVQPECPRTSSPHQMDSGELFGTF